MMLNQKGFTAVEVVIGIGLTAILTTAIITTQLMVSKDQVALQNSLDDSIDTNLAERTLFIDFNNVDPSYNNLDLKDDAGLGFFDYYPDLPKSAIKKSIERNATLSLASGRKEFYILVQDPKAGSMMNYDPVAAYLVGPTPADFNVSATLKYDSINRKNWVSQQRAGFWVEGRLLLLDTPARLRPVDIAGNIDMQVVPRSPIFVGRVAGGLFVPDANITPLVKTTHPETGATIANADIFLRKAPSVGGGQSIVRLRAVRMIKYVLEPQNDVRYGKNAAYLKKSVYENGAWTLPTVLADRVEELHLKRDSVLKRMIYFKVKKTKNSGAAQTAGL